MLSTKVSTLLYLIKPLKATVLHITVFHCSHIDIQARVNINSFHCRQWHLCPSGLQFMADLFWDGYWIPSDHQDTFSLSLGWKFGFSFQHWLWTYFYWFSQSSPIYIGRDIYKKSAGQATAGMLNDTKELQQLSVYFNPANVQKPNNLSKRNREELKSLNKKVDISILRFVDVYICICVYVYQCMCMFVHMQ